MFRNTCAINDVSTLNTQGKKKMNATNTASTFGTNVSVASFNWVMADNAELDALVEAGLATVDPKERESIYGDLQKLIMDEAMVKPLNVWNRIWGVRNEVKGLSIPAYDPTLFRAFDVYLLEE